MRRAGWGLRVQHSVAVDEVKLIERMRGDTRWELSPVEKEALVREMVHQGLTDAEISRRCGYPRQTITRIRDRLGLPPGRIFAMSSGNGGDDGDGGEEGRLVDIHEAAELAGYSVRTVRKWIARGLLESWEQAYAHWVGGPKHLFRVVDVEAAAREWRRLHRRYGR